MYNQEQHFELQIAAKDLKYVPTDILWFSWDHFQSTKKRIALFKMLVKNDVNVEYENFKTLWKLA